MCCPEGVYSNDPEGGCGCNNAKNISPYRMTELHPVIDGSSMIYTFAIDTVVPVEDPASGCNSMDLDEIRIYIDWIYVDHVTSASSTESTRSLRMAPRATSLGSRCSASTRR